MKIAVLSDIHDHVWNLQDLLHGMPEADALIFCGDLCSPFVIDILAQGFAGQIICVDGNNRGDEAVIALKAAGFGPRFQRLGTFAELVEVDGVLLSRAAYEPLHGDFAARQAGGPRLAVSHYPEVALAVAGAGRYDVVCYGHNHTFKIGRVGETLTINPGTVMGYCPSNPPAECDVPATFVVYDTSSRAALGYQITRPEDGQEGSARVVPYPPSH